MAPQVQNSRMHWHGMEKQDRSEQLYQRIKVQVTDDEGQLLEGRHKWTFKGEVVCRNFWAHVHFTSFNTIDTFRKHITAGGTKPPEALPRMPHQKDATQSAKADSWFLQLYQDLGEPYPTEDAYEEISVDELHELIETPGHPLWSLAVALPGGDPMKRYAPKRYLNPGRFQNIWGMYEQSVAKDDAVCKTTLFRAWNCSWKNLLKFRNAGQGKRCKVCAALDEARSKASSTEERQQLIKEKMDHITEIKADRAINVRGNLQSEHDSVSGRTQGSEVLKITIDGMDQAKFRVPRNTVPKEFQTIHGHLQYAIGSGHQKHKFRALGVLCNSFESMEHVGAKLGHGQDASLGGCLGSLGMPLLGASWPFHIVPSCRSNIVPSPR